MTSTNFFQQTPFVFKIQGEIEKYHFGGKLFTLFEKVKKDFYRFPLRSQYFSSVVSFLNYDTNITFF